MPIRIRPVCRHCGRPIQQDEPFSHWYHTENNRGEVNTNTPDTRKCHPFDPASTLAIPKIDVVKLGEP